MAEDLDAFLAHHGVKGMKWGQRKQDGGSSSSSGNSSSGTPKPNLNSLSGGETVSKKDISRKDLRKLNKKNQEEFDAKKAGEVYGEASAEKSGGKKVLVLTDAGYGQMVVTGKEFADHLEMGGAFKPGSTRIYARQQDEGKEFVMNNFQNEVYVPIKRK
ncbi:hypothetical protein SEA_ARTORIAS_16 [Gordonia phage Artorias]|nr:hypothetical protein SEA_ARTORIAS_16 [Gordonia phage Artorias]